MKAFIVESKDRIVGVETIYSSLSEDYIVIRFASKWDMISNLSMLRLDKYDFVVFNQPFSTVIASVLNFRLNAGYLVHINFQEGKKLRAIFGKLFFKYLTLRRIKTFCFSGQLGKSLGVPYLSLSAPILSSYASQFDNERTIDFLFVGRLEYQKGADQLTVIAEALESIGRLVVIGNGTYFESCSSHDQIKCLGGLPRSKALDWMSKAKVLLMPSRFEGLGFVIVEALSRGCKVVAMDCNYGPRDIKVDVNSGLYLAKDFEDFISKAKDAITDNSAISFNKESFLVSNFLRDLNNAFNSNSSLQ